MKTLKCSDCGERFDFDSHEHICKLINLEKQSQPELKTLQELEEDISFCPICDKSIKWECPKCKNKFVFDEYYWIRQDILKAEAVKWVKKDIKDLDNNKLIMITTLIKRWIKRFNLTEDDLE